MGFLWAASFFGLGLAMGGLPSGVLMAISGYLFGSLLE